MNSKITINSQLSTTETKKKATKTNNQQTTRTGTESEKWISHGGFSVERGKGGIGGERYRKEEA